MQEGWRMMGVNRGKQFEDEIRSAIEQVEGSSIERLPDPMAGYAGIKNICDFYCYRYPYVYYLECKSIGGNTLNFKGDITKNQWDGLLARASIYGALTGYLVWFKDHDRTVFVPAVELKRLSDEGSKSLNIKHIEDMQVEFADIPGTKKRVLFSYDGVGLLKQLEKLAYYRWEEDFDENYK